MSAVSTAIGTSDPMIFAPSLFLHSHAFISLLLPWSLSFTLYLSQPWMAAVPLATKRSGPRRTKTVPLPQSRLAAPRRLIAVVVLLVPRGQLHMAMVDRVHRLLLSLHIRLLHILVVIPWLMLRRKLLSVSVAP
jgi:hypothetical protein